jgi:hypothetical protein
LSSNPSITFQDVLANPDKPWSWVGLSRNPSITLKDVLANPDKPWDWTELSSNPSLTMQDVLANPDKPWDWAVLSQTLNLKRDLQALKDRTGLFHEELVAKAWHPTRVQAWLDAGVEIEDLE